MGGLAWFAIPWLTATTMGLSALALENNPVWPTYPDRMSEADVSAGLVLPYAAVALLGKGGAVATLIMVFLAVTSSFNSELIAVSSIATYDVYRTYFNPEASGKRLVWMSHVVMVIYALIICCISIGLSINGISMGYLYVLMGVLISAAVIPATLTLLWSGQNRWAATLSPVLGFICAIVAWLVTASKTCGVLDVTCTGSNDPMLAGNVTALLSPLVFIVILTAIFGIDKYDWVSMSQIRMADDHDVLVGAGLDEEAARQLEALQVANREEEQRKLQKAFKIAVSVCIVLTLSFLVLWPMPMYGSGYIFSKKFFTGWVTVGIIWIFISLIIVGIYPAWESRATMTRVMKVMFTGKNPHQVMAEENQVVEAAPGSGSVTPEKRDPSVKET